MARKKLKNQKAIAARKRDRKRFDQSNGEPAFVVTAPTVAISNPIGQRGAAQFVALATMLARF